jgi:hypothetical protein
MRKIQKSVAKNEVEKLVLFWEEGNDVEEGTHY